MTSHAPTAGETTYMVKHPDHWAIETEHQNGSQHLLGWGRSLASDVNALLELQPPVTS